VFLLGLLYTDWHRVFLILVFVLLALFRRFSFYLLFTITHTTAYRMLGARFMAISKRVFCLAFFFLRGCFSFFSHAACPSSLPLSSSLLFQNFMGVIYAALILLRWFVYSRYLLLLCVCRLCSAERFFSTSAVLFFCVWAYG
jgi:hypothetical protein